MSAGFSSLFIPGRKVFFNSGFLLVGKRAIKVGSGEFMYEYLEYSLRSILKIVLILKNIFFKETKY